MARAGKNWKCLYDRSRTFLRTTFYHYFMISFFFRSMISTSFCGGAFRWKSVHAFRMSSFIWHVSLNGPFSSFHPIVSKIVVVVRGKTISTRGTEEFLYGAFWECAFSSEEITEGDFKVLFLLLYNILAHIIHFSR